MAGLLLVRLLLAHPQVYHLLLRVRLIGTQRPLKMNGAPPNPCMIRYGPMLAIFVITLTPVIWSETFAHR
jgi:hypothetical protein